MALTDKLKAIADGFRSSRGTTVKYTLDEMAVLAAESTTLDTWPIKLIGRGNSKVTSFTIKYINSSGQLTTTTATKGTSVSIDPAVNTVVKITESTGYPMHVSGSPVYPEVYALNFNSVELALWVGNAPSRPLHQIDLYASDYTCYVEVDTRDDYGGVQVSYINSSGSRVTTTVGNNTTSKLTVMCGTELRLIDITGDGLYFNENSNWLQLPTSSTYVAYQVPTYPNITYGITMSRD